MSDGTSWLHRLDAGWKLAALVLGGTAVLLTSRAPLLLAALGLVTAGHVAARIPVREAWGQLRPALPLLAVVFVAQALLVDAASGLLAVARMLVLLALAALVSATTPASAMTRALERGLRPLAQWGVRPRGVALALSLAVRFLPLLADRARQVREAQRARGLEGNMLALAVPLVVQALKMAHDLAEAIEARGFDIDAPVE